MKTANTNIIILPKRLLDSAAAKKESRPALEGAFVDAENRTVVICNGRVLVVHPIPGENPVKPGYITPKLWTAAKSYGRKDTMEFNFVDGTLNGLPIEDQEINGRYPNWRQVVSTATPAYRASFSPEYLGFIAKSLGVTATEPVTLEFDESGLAPIRIRYKDSYGVLMPCGAADPTGSLLPPATEAGAAARIAELQAQVAALSERSDTSPADSADATLVASLKAALHEERTQVKQLEARMDLQKRDFDQRVNAFAAKVKDLEARIAAALAASPVKPLDKAPAAPPKGPKEKPPVPMATRPPVLAHNADRNGIELRFDGKPNDATRESLKAHGWRWLPGQPGQPWAVRYSEEEWLFANHLANGDAYTPMPATPAPATPQPPVIKAPANLGFLNF